MILIPLTQGKFATIDDEDWDLVNDYKWYAYYEHGNWYAYTNIRKSDGTRTKLPMHRLIMNAKFGEQVDHKDHNGLNNQKYNLRNCTHTENQQNQKKQEFRNGKKTSSIYKGVCWHKAANKWMTHIQVDSKQIYLGIFTTEIEAAKAYNKAAIKYFGEFAHLNII